MTEVGNTGIYKGAFTPTQVGTYVVVVSSVSSSPAIADKAGIVEVVNYNETDLAGAGFISATDSQEAIRNAIDTVAAAVNSPTSRGSVMV